LGGARGGLKRLYGVTALRIEEEKGRIGDGDINPGNSTKLHVPRG
jgi:hypothetical protein